MAPFHSVSGSRNFIGKLRGPGSHPMNVDDHGRAARTEHGQDAKTDSKMHARTGRDDGQ